ncbi:MAG: tRNA lysidine(34) synthetase TilS [Gemmatimonadales bacterium]|nr:tRNA lysidine(34) synthetase TilS [Gemmatimonadales bacterium]
MACANLRGRAINFRPMDLLAEFHAHLSTLRIPSGRALVAVSGGPDSVALLDLLLRCADRHRLEPIAAHVDHGIHPDSARVAERLRDYAGERGILWESVALGLGAGSGETEARLARYAWLAATRLRLGAATVFTAHHADDQVETVLMRALAGSGPAGLAGMRAVSGWLVRPLLPFRREMLLRYVRERSLPVWIDPANADPAHLRSWLRVELLPFLRRRVAAVDDRLLRAGRQAARGRDAWDAALDRLPELDPRADDGGISVAGAPLGGYDSALAESVIMALARRAGCPLGPTRAARVLALVARGTSGAHVPLGGGWRAELSFGRLRLARIADSTRDAPWMLDGNAGEGAWGRWRLRWRPERAPERQERAAFVAWFTPDPLLVRGWSPGDRVRPLAGAGRRLVVRCFQDARVPRRRREEWPVVAAKAAIVWIPGVCRSDALLPSGGAEALRVDAEYA